MKIIVAESAGFCWGVRRAMDRTLDLVDRGSDHSVVSLGPLIHNRQVVDFLQSRGVSPVNSPDDVESQSTVIVRAHGVPPETLRSLKDRGATVCNLTCPKVGRIQGMVQKYHRKGYTIFVTGDADHAEVISINGYAGNQAVLLSSPDAVRDIPAFDRGLLVSQTTFNRETFRAIAALLEDKGKELVVMDTICDSTRRRQEEVRRLAPTVDAMVIVGGRHSANTTRLAEIAAESCPRVFHVETESELAEADLSGVERIGISAGASTPNWMINAVVQYLRFLGQRRRFSFIVFGLLFYFNLVRSVAAGALTAGMLMLVGADWSFNASLLSFLYMFLVTGINRLIGLGPIRFTDPARYHFIRSARHVLAALLALSFALLAILAVQWTPSSRFLLAIAVVLGVLYRVRIPVRNKTVRLFDLPGSKNLLHAAAWTLVMVAIPIRESTQTLDIRVWAAALISAFALVFAGSVLFDVRDLQGDRFSGKETLPMLVGRTAAIRWTAAAGALLFLAAAGLAQVGGRHCLAATGILLLAYMIILFRYVNSRQHIPATGTFELLVNGQVLAPLILGLLCRLIP